MYRGVPQLSWVEWLAGAATAISLFSFTLYTLFRPDAYLALSAMLTCMLGCLVILQYNLRREIIKEMLERVGKDA